MANGIYIVVENSGMERECDIKSFASYGDAVRFKDKYYGANERDREHPDCLFPDICVEIDGDRSYEI